MDTLHRDRAIPTERFGDPVTLERLLRLVRHGDAARRLLARRGECGPSVLQIGILVQLERAGPLHVRELGRRLNCRRQSVDQAVDGLARLRWIRPVPSTDRRLRRWAATPDGLEALARLRERIGRLRGWAVTRALDFDGREGCWEF